MDEKKQQQEKLVPTAITLGLTTSKDKVAAQVVVTAGGRGCEAPVRFVVDGRPKGFVSTNDAGMLDKVFSGLSPGEHVIEVKIPGTGLTDTERISVKTKSVGPVGWAIMAAYWLLVMNFGGYGRLTSAYLLGTVIILYLLALRETGGEEVNKKFAEKIGDNDWVLKATIWMAVVSATIWWIDPTQGLELNPIKVAKDSLGGLKDALIKPPTDPLGRKSSWETIDSFFLGKGNWGWAMLSYLGCLFFALPVSKWDETKDWLKNRGSRKSGEKGGHGPWGWVVENAMFDLVKNIITKGK